VQNFLEKVQTGQSWTSDRLKPEHRVKLAHTRLKPAHPPGQLIFILPHRSSAGPATPRSPAGSARLLSCSIRHRRPAQLPAPLAHSPHQRAARPFPRSTSSRMHTPRIAEPPCSASARPHQLHLALFSFTRALTPQLPAATCASHAAVLLPTRARSRSLLTTRAPAQRLPRAQASSAHCYAPHATTIGPSRSARIAPAWSPLPLAPPRSRPLLSPPRPCAYPQVRK
jgi:hypothetical protein